LKGLDDRFLINIDHHSSGRTFADINWIDTEACAVGEMVYDLTRLAGAKITPEIATCPIYARCLQIQGIPVHGTDDNTFELARDLVRHGADPAMIAQQVYFAYPTSKMLLLGAALSNLRREGRLAWMWITHDDMLRTNAAEEDCEGLVTMRLALPAWKWRFFFAN